MGGGEAAEMSRLEMEARPEDEEEEEEDDDDDDDDEDVEEAEWRRRRWWSWWVVRSPLWAWRRSLYARVWPVSPRAHWNGKRT